MKSGVFFAVLSVGLATAGAWSELCARHLKAGDCDFYRGCVEALFPCGPSGYALAFGEKYCQRFNNHSRERLLDVRGQDWVQEVTQCLMQAIMDIPLTALPTGDTTDDGACETFLRLAMESHVPCYLNSDFCRVFVNSWRNAWGLVSAIDWMELAPGRLHSRHAWIQLMNLLWSCTQTWSNDILAHVS